MANSPERPPASLSERNERVVITTTEARQGVVVGGMRHVLAFGILGVVVAFALIYFAFFG